jgi:hypothetical protein
MALVLWTLNYDQEKCQNRYENELMFLIVIISTNEKRDPSEQPSKNQSKFNVKIEPIRRIKKS